MALTLSPSSGAPCAPSQLPEVHLHQVESISDLHGGGERGWEGPGIPGEGRKAGSPLPS